MDKETKVPDRGLAVQRVIEKTMSVASNSPEFVRALLEASDEIAKIDASIAERTSEEACRVAEGLRDAALLARALTRYAWQLTLLGRLDRGFIHATRARLIAQSLRNPVLENGARYVLAWIRGRSGDTETAATCWRQMIAGAQMRNEQIFEAKCHLMLGLLLRQTGKPKESAGESQIAFDLYTALDNADRSMAANNRAMALIDAGQLEEAVRWSEVALATCPDGADLWRSQFQHTQGRALLELNDLERAGDCFRIALAHIDQVTGDTRHTTMLACDIGRLARRLGNSHESLRVLHNALKVAEDNRVEADIKATIHAELYAAYAALGAHDIALQHCALEAQERRRHDEQQIAQAGALIAASHKLVMLRTIWREDIFRSA